MLFHLRTKYLQGILYCTVVISTWNFALTQQKLTEVEVWMWILCTHFKGRVEIRAYRKIMLATILEALRIKTSKEKQRHELDRGIVKVSGIVTEHLDPAMPEARSSLPLLLCGWILSAQANLCRVCHLQREQYCLIQTQHKWSVHLCVDPRAGCLGRCRVVRYPQVQEWEHVCVTG